MKSVVVTGAGTGIGAATSRLFSERGYQVVLLGRNQASLEETARGLKNAEVRVCDLQKTEELAALGKEISTRFEVEVLVNNAGIIERGAFIETSLDSWKSQFETNLFGALTITQALLPKMAERKQGAIVNVASSLGIRPTIGTTAYSASKAALISWTQGLALEMAPFGIRVNAVCPGIVDTPILTGHKGSLSSQDGKRLGSLHPLGRLGKPEEIAEAIWYLSQAKWTTGASLLVDGGISLTQN